MFLWKNLQETKLVYFHMEIWPTSVFRLKKCTFLYIYIGHRHSKSSWISIARWPIFILLGLSGEWINQRHPTLNENMYTWFYHIYLGNSNFVIQKMRKKIRKKKKIITLLKFYNHLWCSDPKNDRIRKWQNSKWTN